MMEKEKAIAFVNYNVQSMNRKQLICKLLFALGMSVPCALLGSYTLFTTILFGVFDILLIIYSIKLLISKKVAPKEQNAYMGIQMLYISIILVFASYKFAISEKQSNIILLLMTIVVFIIGASSLNFAVYQNVKKGAYLKEGGNNKKKIVAYAFVGSGAAMIFSRVFLRSLDQETVELFLYILVLVIAIFVSSGGVYLQKYYWQRKLKLE